MRDRSVIPEGDRVLFPAPADLMVRRGVDMSEEQIEECI